MSVHKVGNVGRSQFVIESVKDARLSLWRKCQFDTSKVFLEIKIYDTHPLKKIKAYTKSMHEILVDESNRLL